MVKKFEIWDSRINMDDWKDFIEEKRLEYPGEYDDDDKMYDHIIDINGYYLEDERMNLSIQLSNPILVIGDLGVDLGRGDPFMSQHLADRFQRYTLRKRDRCGKGMPRHVDRRVERQTSMSGNMT